MCRFIVYKGVEPIQLAHLVTRPRHSIINQAFESRLRFPSSRPMNADGFGIGWYDPSAYPAAGVMPQPTTAHAPNHSNLPPITPSVSSLAVSSESSPTNTFSPIDFNRAKLPPGLRQMNEEEEPPLTAEEEDAKNEAFLRRREEEMKLEAERPCIFKSLAPAWSNANLTRLAEKIRSPLIFAHVRASTTPGAPSEDNCHPWVFDKLMWMHNGEISDFPKIKRALQQSLSEELFLYPTGYSDSEWAFMMFLSKLRNPHARYFTHVELRDAMMETIHSINRMCKAANVSGPSLLNFVVSDGINVVATRYISSRTSEASSLFFSSGTSFDEYQEGGLYRMTKADKRENIIMIASEPLTFEASEWMEVKTNTMIVLTPKMNLLQIPILDEFWVPPQDPAFTQRSKDFAINKGFGHGFASIHAAA